MLGSVGGCLVLLMLDNLVKNFEKYIIRTFQIDLSSFTDLFGGLVDG